MISPPPVANRARREADTERFAPLPSNRVHASLPRRHHAHDRLVQGLAALGAEEAGIAVVEDAAIGGRIRRPVAARALPNRFSTGFFDSSDARAKMRGRNRTAAEPFMHNTFEIRRNRQRHLIGWPRSTHIHSDRLSDASDPNCSHRCPTVAPGADQFPVTFTAHTQLAGLLTMRT
jgi:hypothetical protein